MIAAGPSHSKDLLVESMMQNKLAIRKHFSSKNPSCLCFTLFSGKLCIEVTPEDKIVTFAEELCIGCGLCAKVGQICPCIYQRSGFKNCVIISILLCHNLILHNNNPLVEL